MKTMTKTLLALAIVMVLVPFSVGVAGAQGGGRAAFLGENYSVHLPGGWFVAELDGAYELSHGDMVLVIYTPEQLANEVRISPEDSVEDALIEAQDELYLVEVGYEHLESELVNDLPMTMFEFTTDDDEIGFAMMIETSDGMMMAEFYAPEADYDEYRELAMTIIYSVQQA